VWYKATNRLLSKLPDNTLRDAWYSYADSGETPWPVLARGSHVTGSAASFGWLRQYKRQMQ